MRIQEIMVKNVKYLVKNDSHKALNRLQSILIDLGNDYSSYERVLQVAEKNGIRLFRYYNEKYKDESYYTRTPQEYIENAMNGIFIKIFLEHNKTSYGKVKDIYPGSMYTYSKGYGYMSETMKRRIEKAIEGLNLI